MNSLAAEARTFDLELTPVQQAQFETYYQLLIEWNARFNLTSITAYPDVQVKHYLDSLSAAPVLQQAGAADKHLVDIGAGAGFPGIPLAIVFPTLRVTLLEGTGKKVQFLNEVARALSLPNVTAIHARAEEAAHKSAAREQFDFAVARAVASMRTLAEYALPFVRVGGLFIAYKAVDAAQETEAAQNALTQLGGRVQSQIPIQLADLTDVRTLIVIEKIKPTPPIYPRAAGLPRTQPL